MIDPAHPDFDSPPSAPSRPTFAYKTAAPDRASVLTVVTSFDGDRDLFAETASSVLGQSFQALELLVTADAAPRAEARDVVDDLQRRDPRVRFVDDVRLAVAEATGEYVLQVAAGDLLEPTAAEKWLWYLVSHPDRSRVGSFHVSLAERRLVTDAGSGVGVARRRAFLSGSAARAGTLPEFLYWSRHRSTPPSASSDEAGRRRSRKRRAAPLDAPPFANQLAKTKRRLLVIVPWVTTGGADKFTIDLVSQLHEREWEITLLTTLNGDNSWLPRINRRTPDVFALPDLIEPVEYPRFIRYIVESRRPDAMLISNSLFAYGALPYLRRAGNGMAIVDYCHSVVENWLDGGYPMLSVDRQRFLDLQIVSSAALKEWMVERGGDPARIEVCYIGTELEDHLERPSRAELALRDDEVILLYPCRLTYEKQPAVFAETVLELHRQQHAFRVLVVGDGPYLEWLRSFVKRSGLEECVSFAGFVPNQRVRQLMSVADCVFLPSKLEGISAVLYEAMAEGVAVVGADVGGQRELVASGCGVLVPPGTAEEQVRRYTEVLAGLIEDPATARRMGQAARERISAEFTVAAMGTRLEALLERAVDAAASTLQPLPAEQEASAAAEEAIRLASWTSSAGGSFGPISWRVRHLLFRALRAIAMPVYRLGMRFGAHWLEPLKDRVFRALFPGAE